MRKHILIIALVMVFGLVAAGTGMAQTLEESGLRVSATVGASCKITTVEEIAFGAYDPTDFVNYVDADGAINFRCVQGTSYQTYITGSRAMQNTDGDSLAFKLYSDSGLLNEFPSASPGIPGTAPDNIIHATDVYGRINQGVDVPAGDYEITLTATIEY